MIIPFMYRLKWNGIDSISLNPDSVVEVIKKVYQAEQKLKAEFL